MEKSKLKINHQEIWGTVLILNSLLIFLSSLVISLGNSISDGTLWICTALLFGGAILLTNGTSKPNKKS